MDHQSGCCHTEQPSGHDKHKGNHSQSGHDKHAGHSPEMFKQKFWLSFILTIPALYFSKTIQELLNYNSPAFVGSEYVTDILGTIIFFYGGLVFLKSAKAELAQKQPGMMTLISLAITVAFVYSLSITLGLVAGMDFWWELATLVTIMLLGHWLEMASVSNAQSALNELAKLLPDQAELISGDNTKKVDVSTLKIGDKILIRPGAKVPTDGQVTSGESKLNESMLTGESNPVNKVKGATVYAGTINGSGSLTIEVTKNNDETALAGIMKLVAEAQSSKSNTQLLADKAAYYLTYIAIFSALATALVWSLATSADGGFILERVVTVLIIACPHALGLAIPLVTAISTSKAASSGLLIRQRPALEAARKVDVVLFDKTGTLTKGEQGVVGIIGKDKNDLLRIAGSVEYESEHSIAKAIVNYAKTHRVKLAETSSFSALEGRGATAVIDKRRYYIGGPKMLSEQKAAVPKDLEQDIKSAQKNGQSVIYLLSGRQVLGAILVADVIRSESREAVAALKHTGKRIAMLTGDSKEVARWVAKELGIDEYYAEVLPENKSDVVKQLQADGSSVAMVGDGVNDAPALTQADIGIAIGAGTDVAIESAGIVLASSDPRGVLRVINLSRRTYGKMVQNLAWATGYNAFAIPLAAGVTASAGFILSPALGAVLMSLSTIIVALNAQLLRGVKI